MREGKCEDYKHHEKDEDLQHSMDLAFACLPGIYKVSKKFRLCGLGATKILVRVGTTRFRCGAKTETIVLPTEMDGSELSVLSPRR